MTKEEILKGIEAMQKVQQSNPPSSEKWQRASAVLRELVKQLTGKYPQDACGRWWQDGTCCTVFKRKRRITTMKETLLTRHDDGLGEGEFDSIRWAFEEHVKTPDTGLYNAAVLYGNEDAPEMIDFYTQAEPLITDSVAYRWIRPQQE